MEFNLSKVTTAIFNANVTIPEEYANKECIYKISIDNKIIYIGYTHNLFLDVYDLLRDIKNLGVQILRYRGLRELINYGYDVILEPMDEGNYDRYLDYINEYRPMLNSTLTVKYFDNMRTITKEEKSQIMKQYHSSLGYLTGDNEAVYYIDKKMNIYRVLRKS